MSDKSSLMREFLSEDFYNEEILDNFDSYDNLIDAYRYCMENNKVFSLKELKEDKDFENFVKGIDTKQDKLTAGDNITIKNNVISASGGSSTGGTQLYRHHWTTSNTFSSGQRISISVVNTDSKYLTEWSEISNAIKNCISFRAYGYLIADYGEDYYGNSDFKYDAINDVLTVYIMGTSYTITHFGSNDSLEKL